jgi:release factor glutamine methyltransferase
VLSRPEAELSPEVRDRFFSLVGERARRRPLQHLTGRQGFWRHDFLVTPDVLIPRPETELLVEQGLAVIRDVERPTVVDVGTGSGCIALSLAAERPDAVVHAIDVSAAALAVAAENASRLGLRERVTFHLGDLLAPLRSALGALDLVVSNPPYVDPADAASLAPEVRDHEPALALFAGGADPYLVYRRLGASAAGGLRGGGGLLVEVGEGMADEVSGICAAQGFTVRRVFADLRGIPRAVYAQRPARPPAG